MTANKVYFWGGEHHSPDYAGGWVNVTWAAAVGSLDELRSLCTEQRATWLRLDSCSSGSRIAL